DVEEAPQFPERIRRIVDTDVDDALDGGFGVRRYRPDDENAGGLHAAHVAAFGLTGVERRHQAIGHRALAVRVGRGHRLHDLLADERVALNGEIRAGDMAGVSAQVHWIVRIEVAVDHALARVDRRTSFRVDDAHLTRVASWILVGDSLDDFGRRQPLLEQ